MTKIIGVRFRNVGKIYYFSPQDFDIYTGDHVIVETARGIEYGTVVLAPRDVEDDSIVQPLKDVLRVATLEDDEHEAENRKKEREAFEICLEKIHSHGLEMKLIDAEYTFDNNKVLFYFTADGRVDFRELVKDLAAVFKTRIELRQIGVRDETKILGGIGICGRPLCCHTYLSEFAPVSIKMAKEQNLSLNPTKISGTCGRLMCCLKNEQETYEYLNSKLPAVGDHATTPDGLSGEVQSVSVLRQMVKVLVELDGDEKEIQEYKVDDLSFQRRVKSRREQDNSEYAEELKQLEEDTAAELKMAEDQTPEKKSFEKKRGKGEFKQGERRTSDRRSQERKPSDKKMQEKKSQDRRSQDGKNQERSFDKKNHENKNHENRNEQRSERDNDRTKSKKYRNHRGRDKQHDSNVTSEGTVG